MTDRWRYACPECGSRQVRRASGQGSRFGETYWSCDRDTCQATFDSPVDLKQS